MKISFIGAGNVATHLAIGLEQAGCRLIQVYSRNIHTAIELTSRLYAAEPTDNLDFSQSEAEIFIFCVPDTALLEIIPITRLPVGALAIHTAGSVPIHVLDSVAGRTGVFYPVQTFSKNRKLDFKNIPFCLESSDEQVLQVLQALAGFLGSASIELDSTKRQAVHISAIFACNFTNHLFSISKNIMESELIDFQILEPLIKETITKALTLGPENSQTGPALRNDLVTLNAHIQYLEHNSELRQIYKILSESIFYSR